MERGDHTAEGLLVEPHRGPTQGQPVPKGLHPMEGTQTGAVFEKQQPLERTHDGKIQRPVSRGRDPLEQEKDVRTPVCEEEEKAETTCDELTAASISYLLCHCVWGGGGM